MRSPLHRPQTHAYLDTSHPNQHAPHTGGEPGEVDSESQPHPATPEQLDSRRGIASVQCYADQLREDRVCETMRHLKTRHLADGVEQPAGLLVRLEVPRRVMVAEVRE